MNTMHYVQVSLIGLIAIVLGVSAPMVSLPLFQTSQVLAQIPAGRKAEADQLFNQGNEQFQTSHFTALELWEKALIIYREIKDRESEGRSLNNLGTAYISLGDYNKAIDYEQQSLTIARELKDRSIEGQSLNNLGLAYYSLGDYNKAIDYEQQSLTIAREIKDRLGEGQSLGNLGLAYFSLGDYKKAIDYHQQSLAIARELKDRSIEGQSLNNLGLAYYSLGDYKKAIDYQKQSLTIARGLKDRYVEGQSLNNLGLAYYSLGDYKKAIDYEQQSLVIASEFKDRYSEVTTLSNLGRAYSQLGDYNKVIDYEQQGLVIVRELKDRHSEVSALFNLGEAYLQLRDYEKAVDYQQQSLNIARELKDRHSEVSVLDSLGTALIELGNYEKAIDYQQQSLNIARELKDRHSEGNALYGLGSAYVLLGDYIKTIDYEQQSLNIARELKDRNSESRALDALGVTYDALGDDDKAIDYQQKALAIAHDIKDRQNEVFALVALGDIYHSVGDDDKAIDYQQKILAIIGDIKDLRSKGKALVGVATYYEVLGNYEKAIDYEQQSLNIARELKDRYGEASSLVDLGHFCYYLGDYEKAIRYSQQGLAIAHKIKDRNGEGLSLNNLGAAFQKSSNLPEAEKALYQGIEVWESVRGKLGNNDTYKVSIFEEQAITYRTLQQVLIAENKPNEALEVSERGRSRAFVELLSSHLSNKNISQTLEPNVDKPTILLFQQIAKQHHATLVQYSIIYDAFKLKGKQKSKESELYIWVIKPTGEITFRKADLKALWQNEHTTLVDLVISSRQYIGVSDRGINVSYVPKPNALKTKQGLQRLHELLIKPIADLLPKQESEKVVFIPQSSLFFVPFPALQDENGKYLIEKHTILTAPSIQVLDLTHKQQVGHTDAKILPGDILVVGNPTMPKIPITNEQLPPLAGAEQEAIQIAKLFQTTAITHNDAKKTTVVQKMANARIIHFATHGLVDDFKGFGVPGAIAFAPDGKDDGFLTSGEIFDLKLHAELVVLSACDTGVGRITGDGVIGLSRSLISAGVPSVIVSLWSIDDGSTSLLMTEFYQNLQQKQDKATALRQAMLTTMKKYPSPLNWAAFTLIGESN